MHDQNLDPPLIFVTSPPLLHFIFFEQIPPPSRWSLTRPSRPSSTESDSLQTCVMCLEEFKPQNMFISHCHCSPNIAHVCVPCAKRLVEQTIEETAKDGVACPVCNSSVTPDVTNLISFLDIFAFPDDNFSVSPRSSTSRKIQFQNFFFVPCLGDLRNWAAVDILQLAPSGLQTKFLDRLRRFPILHACLKTHSQ